MNTRDEILIAIGRIEGKLEAFASLSQRVSTLERWQAWLKGGWAAMAAMLFSRIPVEVVDKGAGVMPAPFFIPAHRHIAHRGCVHVICVHEEHHPVPGRRSH